MDKISIVIPTYNPPNLEWKVDKYLKPCIDSVCRFTSDNIKIKIISNGSSIYTKNVLDRLPRVEMLWFEQGLGFAGAVNAGISTCLDSDFIILLNDDTVILPSERDVWISKLLNPFHEDEKLGATGVHQLFCPILNFHFIVGYCLALRTKAVKEIGLFDTAFELGSQEEIDYEKRLELYGWGQKIVTTSVLQNGFYVGDFPLWHKGEATFNEIPEANFYGDKNKKLLQDRVNANYYKNPFKPAETVRFI